MSFFVYHNKINLLPPDVKNAVQSAWPAFINSIEIDADECMQGQISNLHVQIDKLKDTLHDAKKSYCNAEVALTKEHSHVKDLEQELKDLKSPSQVEANTSALPPATMAIAGQTSWVVIPTPCLSQRPGLLACPHLEMRQDLLPHLRRSTSGATSPWKWMMNTTG